MSDLYNIITVVCNSKYVTWFLILGLIAAKYYRTHICSVERIPLFKIRVQSQFNQKHVNENTISLKPCSCGINEMYHETQCILYSFFFFRLDIQCYAWLVRLSGVDSF